MQRPYANYVFDTRKFPQETQTQEGGWTETRYVSITLWRATYGTRNVPNANVTVPAGSKENEMPTMPNEHRQAYTHCTDSQLQ